MTPHIPLIAWLPDADPTVPGVLTAVQNMLPTLRGYAADSALGPAVDYESTLITEPTSAQTVGLTPYVSYGITLSGFVAGAWRVLSRSSAPYAAASVYNPWRFATVLDASGNQFDLAVQYENVLQAKTAGTTGLFADVSGAPRADTMATQRGFVLLGAYTTGGVYYPNGWICSALEDYSDWTPDIATQSAKGQLTATPGQIIRLVSFLDYVIAFKADSMYRGTYVGASSNTWTWPVLSRSVGLVSHDAVCEASGVLYWMARDGFYRYNGAAIERIRSAPWEWLVAQTPFGTGFDVGTQCVYDPAQRAVRWVFRFAYSGTGRLILTYHIDTDRWGMTIAPTIVRTFTLPGTTVRRQPQDGQVFLPQVPAYFVQDASQYVLSIASLTPAASSFTTGDIGDDDAAATLRRARVRFLSSPTTSFATQYHRMTLDGVLTTGETIARADGKYDLAHAARWHRLKFAQTGDYEVVGFRVDAANAGRR